MRKEIEMRADRNDVTPPLVVHIIYSLSTGGLENGMINIINRSPPDRYRHAIISLTAADEFASRLTAPDVVVIELHKKPGHDLGMYWRLWRALRQLKPTIVHSRNMAALETQAMGILFPGCKRIHAEHGRDINDLDGSNRKYQWFRRLLNPFVHRFVAVSQDLADWLVQTVGIAENKVMQIYDGVDSSRFIPRSDVLAGAKQSGLEARLQPWPKGLPTDFLPLNDRIVIGTVGRLAAVKNQTLLLRALHQILQRQPDLSERLRCIIVGDGPQRSELEQTIASLSLQSIVWLAGNSNDVPAWLSHFDVFALPSLAEGIPNTILEAMATGLPVIATAVGGNPELVEHDVTGLLVPSGDTNALADAMLRLIENPQQRLMMGRVAVARIHETFNWDNTMNAYLQIYDELLYGSETRKEADKA